MLFFLKHIFLIILFLISKKINMKKDFKDHVTSFSSLSFHPHSQVIHVSLSHILWKDSFMDGIDATSATVEWAMAELPQNPEKYVCRT